MATYISNTTANTTWVANVTVITAARLNTENTNLLANDVALDTALALSHDATGYFNPTVGSSTAAANALTLPAGNIFPITGNTEIQTIATKGTGYMVWLVIAGTPNLKHDSTNMDLPDDSDIQLAAGDVVCLYEYGAGTWRMISISRSDASSGVLSVANGGTGLSSITDGALMLGSGTSAVTALALTTDGAIVIGDGTTDPVTYAAFSSSTGTLNPSAGGTGAATLTDGGILIGSGVGAITALGVLADGSIVVGDGATDPVAITLLTNSTGVLIHERGGIEADISAIADGGMLVGTGAGTMAIRAGALTAGAAGFLTHEVGGLEFSLAAVAIGDIVAGTGSGTMALITSTGHSDGDVLTRQADGSVDYEAIPAASGGDIDTVVSKTANYTASWGELVLCDTSGGSFTITLPAASTNDGKVIIVKHVTAGNTLTIDGNAAETIDGSATVTDTLAGNAFALISDGTNVQII
tara:strand:- start:3279 stop:4685 length:1407 start_codon:yes stop_codon:yes gene_type:complete